MTMTIPGFSDFGADWVSDPLQSDGSYLYKTMLVSSWRAKRPSVQAGSMTIQPDGSYSNKAILVSSS